MAGRQWLLRLGLTLAAIAAGVTLLVAYFAGLSWLGNTFLQQRISPAQVRVVVYTIAGLGLVLGGLNLILLLRLARRRRGQPPATS